ncbi:MAG TPA: pantoate--beta-alanine ligase [Candidatus Limnocylindria bacterium]|nr:pantoate--beta-alanine ligase [Candidatus Limnocylindria bacterium]
MITVLRTAAEVRAWRGTGRAGLVPTMGALHEGHASLVRASRAENDRTLVSIFVNPTQFSPDEDYRAYPRDEAKDLALLAGLGADAAFVPGVEEMYPPGDATRVEPGPVAAPLEGARRPGHFVGVATVVTKLLAIARPDRAYFGQKDYQQLRVLQTVARDLAFGVRIVACPIVRDPDGLALSSRNAYLSPAERARALALSRGLFAARDAFERGERHAAALRAIVSEHARTAGELDYVSVADPFTLAEQEGPVTRAVISLACRVGRARLIDNTLVGLALEEVS